MTKFTVKINFFGSLLLDRDKKRLRQAALIIEQVVNHPQFKDEILKANFFGETSQFKNKTNLEIYKHIISGSESLKPEIDNEADILQGAFKPKWWKRDPIGYTYRNVLEQWMNLQYLRVSPVSKLASNMFHEWLHKMGFDHDFKATSRRPYSVCYQGNKILEKIYKQVPASNSSTHTQTEKPSTTSIKSRGLSLFSKIKRFFNRLL
tara:strand:+ start:32042 stop:32659 length:618 start_codon:yes stop_codon:yes gene_type:complete